MAQKTTLKEFEAVYPKLEEGHTYYISKARVNLAKKKFNTVNNDYELGLERSTTVEECHDGDIIHEKYDFVLLNELSTKQGGDMIGMFYRRNRPFHRN